MKYVDENLRFKPSKVELGQTVEFEIEPISIEENLQLNENYPETNRITLNLLKPEKAKAVSWLYKGKLLPEIKKALKQKKTFKFTVMRFGKNTRDVRYLVVK